MYSGQAGDALSGGANMVEQWSASHNGMQFSTRDQDHDRYQQGNCAVENRGAGGITGDAEGSLDFMITALLYTKHQI